MHRGRLVAAGSVAEIVAASGIGVEGMAARYQLEEAFLQLVGQEAIE
jgi:hypothetical protein